MRQWTKISKEMPPEGLAIPCKVTGLIIKGEPSPPRGEEVKWISTTKGPAWFLRRYRFHEGEGEWLNLRSNQVHEWAKEIIKAKEKESKPLTLTKIKVYEDEIKDRLYEIIKFQFGLDNDKVTLLSRLDKDFDRDGLDDIELLMNIEDDFDIEIPDKKADKWKNVMDIYLYLCDRLEAIEGGDHIDDRFEILDL